MIAEGRLEGKLEGKLETVPRLVAFGLTLQQIAEALNLPVEEVQKATETED